MIYDCFPFFDELDILEIRLNELYNVVDHFVILESNKTYYGLPKPFYLEPNINTRFAFAKDKIIYVKHNLIYPGERWLSEHHQRIAVAKGIENASSEDIISISDVDEIPEHNIFKQACEQVMQHNDNVGILLQQSHFYFNILISNVRRCGPVLNKKANIPDFQHQRNYRDLLSHYCNGGWHLSWAGGTEGIKSKFNNYAKIENTYEGRVYDLNKAIENYTQDIPIVQYDSRPPLEQYIYKLYPLTSKMVPPHVANNLHIYGKYLYKPEETMIPDYWKSIPTHFASTNIYDRTIQESKNDDHFVQIGIKLGKSTCYLSEKIKISEKQIKIDVIDPLEPTDDPDIMFDTFLTNMRNAGLEKSVTLIKKDCLAASSLYRDESLDFIAIDCDNSCEYIINNLIIWYPKLKPGKTICGYCANCNNDLKNVIETYFNIAGKSVQYMDDYTWYVIK
jgi:beta-1,4-mannosyl-glycoprotein beta-1,4-N-acetylglucosaminyltransferase